MQAIAILFIAASSNPTGHDFVNPRKLDQAKLVIGCLNMPPNHRYTCREYREEMTLLGLTAEERRSIEEDIRRLETEMGMD
jgi:hypothetical protein